MTRRAALEAELEALYAKVPPIACKGLCSDSCTVIDLGPVEQRRMRQRGFRIPRLQDALDERADRGYTCPALTSDGQCGAYDVRPMICRVYYADNDRPCPHGCRPLAGKYLTYAESRQLLDAALKLGTAERPIPLEVVGAWLQDPETRDRLREYGVRQHPSMIRHRVDWGKQ
ncbi:YkgJ family cysteine cluster protein [Streptosporangium sp. NPDC020072]|uniref:YkgJ family cysteine cluster protein n=1 Tax=Streptosporangium sp. NPDC020072 TaxID=3154788 RepID=UPI00342FE7F0